MRAALIRFTVIVFSSTISAGCTSASPVVAALDCTAPSEAGGDAVDAAGCPIFDVGGSCGIVTTAEIHEASGLAVSRKAPGVLWTHNDTSDGARIMAIHADGRYLGAHYLLGITATDLEDIAIGPGPQNGETYLYVGDIGDNDKIRANIQVFRVVEPTVDPSAGANVGMINDVETLTFVYPDKPHNAETLMVDPITGDLYIVGKADSGKSPVFRAAAPLTPGAPITLQLDTTLEFGTGNLVGNTSTTGGDILPDGSGITIRTYDSAYFWWRKSGAAVGEALAFKPCALPLQTETHGEAIAFAANGKGYYTLSEGASQPLYYYARK